MAARIAGKQKLLSVVIEDGLITVREAAPPHRPPHFALLELISGGICNTDLELQRGYYNFRGVPGHEFVAKVMDCDRPELMGRRVVGEINIACGHCDFCLQDLGRHCRHRTVLGILNHPGAFSSYFTLPEKNLHVVPESVTDREAVFVEPLAAACEILDQIELSSAEEVAILGDGKLGLLIAQVLLAHGIPVAVVGRHEKKLALAHAAGARTLLSSTLPEACYRCVVECSGSAEGLAAAIRMTRPRGTVVMKSTVHEQVRLNMAPVIVNEISLAGSRCGRFEPALQLLEARRVDVTSLIDAEFELHQAPEAFAKAASRGVMKVLLHNSELR